MDQIIIKNKSPIERLFCESYDMCEPFYDWKLDEDVTENILEWLKHRPDPRNLVIPDFLKDLYEEDIENSSDDEFLYNTYKEFHDEEHIEYIYEDDWEIDWVEWENI